MFGLISVTFTVCSAFTSPISPSPPLVASSVSVSSSRHTSKSTLQRHGKSRARAALLASTMLYRLCYGTSSYRVLLSLRIDGRIVHRRCRHGSRPHPLQPTYTKPVRTSLRPAGLIYTPTVISFSFNPISFVLLHYLIFAILSF